MPNVCGSPWSTRHSLTGRLGSRRRLWAVARACLGERRTPERLPLGVADPRLVHVERSLRTHLRAEPLVVADRAEHPVIGRRDEPAPGAAIAQQHRGYRQLVRQLEAGKGRAMLQYERRAGEVVRRVQPPALTISRIRTLRW